MLTLGASFAVGDMIQPIDNDPYVCFPCSSIQKTKFTLLSMTNKSYRHLRPLHSTYHQVEPLLLLVLSSYPFNTDLSSSAIKYLFNTFNLPLADSNIPTYLSTSFSKSGCSPIPTELVKAARIDGAGISLVQIDDNQSTYKQISRPQV